MKAVNSVRVLDKNIYLMDFNSDYNLDGLLNEGISSVAEIFKFVSGRSHLSKKRVFAGIDAGGGCSTFDAFTLEGDHILARNFDFRDAPFFVVWTHPKDRYASVSVVDANFLLYGKKIRQNSLGSVKTLLAPYCCVDGINEKGLAIAVLQIKAAPTKQNDKTKKNITTTTMIRAVLDTCANVDEAVDFISAYNMHDSLFCSYHYQIVDKSGRSVVVEYIDNKLYVYEKNSSKYTTAGSVYENDGIAFQYVTNFSVTEDIGTYRIEQHGEDRAAAIKKTLAEKQGVMTELESMDLLSYVKLNYKHPKYPWNIVALWSAVYNSEKCTLKLAANMDYTKIYTFSVNKPCEVLETQSITDSAYPQGNWEYL
jgi:hypothetical protein